MNHTAKSARASSAAVLTWAGLLTVLALLTGCTDTREALLNGKARSPGDVISVFPENGAKDVDEETRIAVKVPDGRLESVKVMRIEDAQQQTVA
ncbi:hypothetical protein GA0115253_1005820, partial [Streptomyces sp. Termitarium-T10T-6]